MLMITRRRCGAFGNLAERGKKYNVGGECEWTNLDLVHAICALVDEESGGDGAAELVRFVEDRPGHDQRYAIDASKIQRELGWEARVCFEEGLRETVRWYLANRSWWEPLLG